MKRHMKIIKIILWVLLIYVFACLVVIPFFHKPTGRDKVLSSHDINGSAPERILSIDNNIDALLWRLRLIEAAKERVILVTFDFRDDKSGQDIMAALLQAAEREVEVQILVDGINGSLRLARSKNFQELMAHENVEIKLYNPVHFLKLWKANYRMHDKYLIADDFAYILGGRNTDNLFLGNYQKVYNEDRDILVYETIPGGGTSYMQLIEYFEKIWRLSCCEELRKYEYMKGDLKQHYYEIRNKYPDVFTEPVWEDVTIETNGISLCTNSVESENKSPRLWERLVYEMKQADEILIQTPYIICNRKMYQDLENISTGSKKTELILNAVEGGTNPFGCTDYLNQKCRVRRTGVYIYEYLDGQALHTKTILAGDNISIVGSYNLDMRSTYLDTEMMLVIDCPELNACIRKQTEELKEASRQIKPDGTMTDGKAYHTVEQDIGDRIFYGILRIMIIPFRHLL